MMLITTAFVFVLGQVGGSIFPAITGILAARSGATVLQPILVGLLGATGISWLLIPKDIPAATRLNDSVPDVEGMYIRLSG